MTVVPDKKEIFQLYRRRAKHYDLTANLYYLLGFREFSYRKRAVQNLNLHQGDTVVELGCGTGLNFRFIQAKIGPEGRIIGVDLTDYMLDKARQRTQRQGWKNVEFVQSDAASFRVPDKVNGILSTFAITLEPEYDLVIRDGSMALAAGGRFVVLDIKMPDHAPMWLIKLGVLVMKPFGVSFELATRHPWESIDRHLRRVCFLELFWGFAYISVGEKKGDEK
jgi:ubiquinone/menaquinone biosynthesis C-methylase UbiE